MRKVGEVIIRAHTEVAVPVPLGTPLGEVVFGCSIEQLGD